MRRGVGVLGKPFGWLTPSACVTGRSVIQAQPALGVASLLMHVGQAPALASGYQLDPSFGGDCYVTVE